MIARAAANQPASASAFRHAGSVATILSTGSGSMMTPVEKGSTSSGRTIKFRGRSGAGRPRVRQTPRPVPALALPALITSARTGACRARCSRQTVTGAAQKRFRVKTPAAWVPGARLISSRSSRDQLLMRAGAVPSATPGTGNSCSGVGGV